LKLHCYLHRNFGDGPLNTWLWPQLLPNMLHAESERLFVGIGSLLNDGLPAQPLKVIFGSGIGYGQLAEHLVARPAGWMSTAWYDRQVERNARTLQHLAAHAQPQLTRDAVIQRVTTRLMSALETLKANYQAGRLLPSAQGRSVVATTP
jgi:hypothetical protein